MKKVIFFAAMCLMALTMNAQKCAVLDFQLGTNVTEEETDLISYNFRTNMEELAARLGKKLAGNASASESIGGGSGSTPKQKTVQQGYTDLGLPSGTIWKNFNATGFYTYDEAVSQFGSRLPSKEQWEELKAECQWSWTGSGYKVTGPNGNSITLPAAGYRVCYGSVGSVGSCGYYWSSTPGDSEDAWYLVFGSGGVDMSRYYRCNRQSVRLVQD